MSETVASYLVRVHLRRRIDLLEDAPEPIPPHIEELEATIADAVAVAVGGRSLVASVSGERIDK